MYKADLWRICKLYINGGVYADIDLVPCISLNSILLSTNSFYTCLSIVPNSCFQAFIATEPKNPLLLCFIFELIVLCMIIIDYY